VNDFWDTNGLSNLADVFTAAGNWQMQTVLTQGHWPDCDMLPLGYIGPRPPVGGGARMSALTHNEQVSVMSLWGLMPSPLVLGGNPTKLSTDSWTTALLTNPEVLAVNQDASGTHGKRLSSSGNTQVWSRELTGGRKAVALFNRGTAAATVSVTFAQLGITGTPSVRDVWQRTDVAGATTGISTSVPGGGAMMYLVSPAGASGTGGAGGSVGAGGSGGGVGSAGAGGRGGSSGAGGTAGTGGGGDGTGRGGRAGGAAGGTGNAGTTGVAGTSGIAGTTGAAGTPGVAGGLGTTGVAGISGAAGATGTAGMGAAGSGAAAAGGSASGEDSGGCSCAAAGEGGMPGLLWGILGAIVLMGRRRRRPRAAGVS
jgi:MYXO-CTERM domain-containing protein